MIGSFTNINRINLIVINEFYQYNFNQSYELYSNDSIPNNADFFIRNYENNHCRRFIPPPISDEFAGFVDIFVPQGKVQKPRSWANELLFIITLDNSSIYNFFEINFDSIIIDTKSTSIPFISIYNNFENAKNVSLFSNQHFIARGQYIIYEFIIKTTIRYTSPSYGIFGFKADYNFTKIEIEEKVLAPTPNASYTVLELRFKPDLYFIYQEEEYQTGNIKNIHFLCTVYNYFN